MALLTRRRKPWDETLPSGETVYDVIRRLKPVAPPEPRPLNFETLPQVPVVDAPLPPAPLTRVAPPEMAPLGPDFTPEPAVNPVPIERGSAPVMLTRHNNRPVGAIGGDDALQRDQELLNAQLGYKAPRSTKDALIATALGFLNRGIPGAIGGFAGYQLDQGTRNQYAMGNDIAQTQGRIQRELLTRQQQGELEKAALQQELVRSQIGENRAQTLKALQPAAKKWMIKQDIDGFFHPVDPETGLDPSGKPVRGKVADPNDVALMTDESGMIVPVNKRTGLGQDGKPVRGKSMVQLADGSWVDASQKYMADKQAGQAETTNRALDQNIEAYRAEQRRIDGWLATTPPMVDRTNDYGEVVGKQPNPAYNDLMTRRRQIDDKIAEWNTQKKATAPPLTRGTVSQYAGKPWSLSRWRTNNPNATPEQEAAAKAKAQKAQMKVVE